MMTQKKTTNILLALTVVLVLAVASVRAAANKVSICHGTGNGNYNLLSVAASAVRAHLNHGDQLPWTCDTTRSWNGECSNNLGQSCADGAHYVCDASGEPICGCVDADMSLCTDACVDLSQDTANCGSCNNACSEDETCQDGQCESVSVCSVGETVCPSGCANLAADSANCGACGITCSAGQSCQQGVCVNPPTPAFCPNPMVATYTLDYPAGTLGSYSPWLPVSSAIVGNGEACSAPVSNNLFCYSGAGSQILVTLPFYGTSDRNAGAAVHVVNAPDITQPPQGMFVVHAGPADQDSDPHVLKIYNLMTNQVYASIQFPANYPQLLANTHYVLEAQFSPSSATFGNYGGISASIKVGGTLIRNLISPPIPSFPTYTHTGFLVGRDDATGVTCAESFSVFSGLD